MTCKFKDQIDKEYGNMEGKCWKREGVQMIWRAFRGRSQPGIDRKRERAKTVRNIGPERIVFLKQRNLIAY